MYSQDKEYQRTRKKMTIEIEENEDEYWKKDMQR